MAKNPPPPDSQLGPSLASLQYPIFLLHPVESEAPTMPTPSKLDCENPDFATLSEAIRNFFSSASTSDDVIARRDVALLKISESAQTAYSGLPLLAQSTSTGTSFD